MDKHFIGRISNIGSKVVDVTFTASETAYTAGDCLGGVQKVEGGAEWHGEAVTLQSVTLVDAADQKPEGTLVIFDAEPTDATLTDNAAASITAAASQIIGRVPLVTADWVTTGGTAIAAIRNIGLTLQPGADRRDFWVAFIVSGTPDYAADAAIIAKLGFVRG